MKKTVLFLMNGFGIEQIDSYNIYNSKLMPNLDSYTKNYLFTSIESKATDLKSGYRTFSTSSSLPLSYSLIDNYYNKFNENKNLNFYLNSIRPEGKVQLFLFYENEKSLEHLRAFYNFIKNKNSKMYLHLVLTSSNTSNYKEIEKVITKISYEFKEIKIGIIVGVNSLMIQNLTAFMNMFQNEVGEKWKEISKKLSYLITSKILPRDVKEFYMNEGFKFAVNDNIFFFNYENFDMSNFILNVSKVNNVTDYCSMFEMKGVKYPMFAYPSSGISMANSLKKINAKTLILLDSENIKQVNYYCNGLQNVVSDNICFVKTDDGLSPNYLKSIIRDSNYDLIIINFQIDNSKNIPELNDKLGKLDMMLKVIHDFCVELKISLFISSLYGIQKELPVDNFIKATVNFSLKVPFIVVDPVFNKANFTLNGGDIYTLANTLYTNINPKNEGAVLIRKKDFITKMIKK